MATKAEIEKLIAEQERKHGMPKGLLQSIWIQETGANEKWIENPSTYHYAKDKNGKRKSSAFGLFGTLDSTAKDPGWGVKPLKDKNSVEDQIRFAADYAAARAKSAGTKDKPDWFKGTANYGEGEKYANQVFKRMGTSKDLFAFDNFIESGRKDFPSIVEDLASYSETPQLAQQYTNTREEAAIQAAEQPNDPLGVQGPNAWVEFLKAFKPGPKSVLEGVQMPEATSQQDWMDLAAYGDRDPLLNYLI